MTSCYVIASSKLCPEVGDDYTTLCNFGGRSSVARAALFKAIERGGGGGGGAPPPPPPNLSQEAQEAKESLV